MKFDFRRYSKGSPPRPIELRGPEVVLCLSEAPNPITPGYDETEVLLTFDSSWHGACERYERAYGLGGYMRVREAARAPMSATPEQLEESALAGVAFPSKVI